MDGTDPDSLAIAASLQYPEAFDQVFRRHFASIFRFAARQVGPDDGEDIAAEVFARAFADRTRFDASIAGSARPWLFGICLNVMRSRNRARSRMRRAYGLLPAWVSDGAAERDLEAPLDASRRSVHIWSAIDALRPVARDVLLLAALAELDGAEIALALDLPQGTVRSLLFRARHDLRAVLPQDLSGTNASTPTSPTGGTA